MGRGISFRKRCRDARIQGYVSQSTGGFVSGLTVNTYDVIRVITASGGGYGDPKDRDPEAVKLDVKNGVLSAESARDVYGVET